MDLRFLETTATWCADAFEMTYMVTDYWPCKSHFLILFCSCDFTGTQDELEDHLKTCKFESMKEFLHRTDEKISDLQFALNSKDQEVGFLRSMLGKLSERVETLERNSEVKLGKLSEWVETFKRSSVRLERNSEVKHGKLSERVEMLETNSEVKLGELWIVRERVVWVFIHPANYVCGGGVYCFHVRPSIHAWRFGFSLISWKGNDGNS